MHEYEIRKRNSRSFVTYNVAICYSESEANEYCKEMNESDDKFYYYFIQH